MKKITVLMILLLSLFAIGCGGDKTFSNEHYEFNYPSGWIVQEVEGGKVLLPENKEDYKSPNFRIDTYVDNLDAVGGVENFKKYFSEYKQHSLKNDVQVIEQQEDKDTFKMISHELTSTAMVYEIWYLPGGKAPAHVIMMRYSIKEGEVDKLKAVAEKFYQSFKVK